MLPVTPSFRLDGRKAFITGAGRGIGLAAAAALAQAGAAVTLAARTEKELVDASQQLTDSGAVANYAVLDIKDAAAVAHVLDATGPFDVVVNSAGMNRPKDLVDVSDEDVDDILDLNVKAAFYVARAAARQMKAAGRGGSIINMSSQMGHVGSPQRTLYCASKHALEGMTKALAWEVGADRIRVNTICPTFIETEFTASMFSKPGFRQWVEGKNALSRVGTVEEVMGAVVFLASDASSLMTGTSLMLDAGWTAA